ncbi:hypothetical protein K227x_28620 [Rubripirellula lacrimiformis]|uniref:Immunity protein Imm33 domain-containing protein n=2 Tax=Rubripirellula lacrimiformis TaxID=1930273 RepID=A0A517NBF8_9BACT|nr:DUF2185 domain-containing protein [Rubripirellula lacrimiformis]QDT04471.1 hypothetical protein K227x_28620 [Rubripirellula lacrimiformis]
MEKKFALTAKQIVPLVESMGYCFATDRITVDATSVGFMYREEPDDPNDSGWRFFSGDETQEYVDDPENTMIYNVNDIANYDHDIIPLLATPPPCAFERQDDDSFGPIDPDFLGEDDD